FFVRILYLQSYLLGYLYSIKVYNYYYLFYLKSVAVPSRVHADCESFYEENPPIAHLEAKTSRVCGKKALPEVQRPRSKEKPTSCRLSCSLLSIEGFACHALPMCLQGVIPQVPVLCASLYVCPLPSSSLSF